jgi:hypothetical protein
MAHVWPESLLPQDLAANFIVLYDAKMRGRTTKLRLWNSLKRMVGPNGLEPSTSSVSIF